MTGPGNTDGHGASRPRLPGLARAEQSDHVRALLDAAVARVGGIVGDTADPGAVADSASGTGNPLPTIGLIAHHESLLAPFLGWAGALALEGPLSGRQAELVALRTVWLCGSLFEWQEHEAYGIAAGLEAADVNAIVSGPDDPHWSGLDRALLRAADELHAAATISEDTWAELAAELSPAELVGVTLVAGQYRMLSGLANAAGVDRALAGSLPAAPVPAKARRGLGAPVDPFGLRGTVALVTGGARSIGRASALALAQAGCAVGVMDLADASGTVAAIGRSGGRAFALTADARDPDAVRQAVQELIDRYGRLDVAVNTVGSTTGPRPLLDLTTADWDGVVAQNLSTTLACIQAEALAMIRLGIPGRIVNVASLSGVVGAPNAAGYGAANAGVIHLTGTAALEVARYGIRVNCIVPGTHVTEAVEEAVAANPAIAEWVRMTGGATPLSRLGDMKEAAGVVLFLASDLSSYVTGQSVIADGGMALTTARPPMGLDQEAAAAVEARGPA